MFHQINCAELSRAYLTQSNGIEEMNEESHRVWCKNGLHKTVCVRVIVTLPSHF